jgi:hypothetical protein
MPPPTANAHSASRLPDLRASVKLSPPLVELVETRSPTLVEPVETRSHTLVEPVETPLAIRITSL